MAEGGQLPWKTQIIDTSRGPAADYSTIHSPLPKPPNGVEWQQDVNTREWRLVRTDDEEISRRKYKLQVGTAWNERLGRVEPTIVPVPKKEEEEKEEKVQPTSETETPPAVQGVDFLIHTVLPSDTLVGLCLRYKTKPTTLRQINKFSGSNLHLAPHNLIIPLKGENGENLLDKVRMQDTDCPEYKLQAFLVEFPHLRQCERRAYLEMDDWDLEAAMASAKEDDEWERQQEKEEKQKPLPCKPLEVHMAVPATDLPVKQVEKVQTTMKEGYESELVTPLLMRELELARRDHA